MRVIIVEDEVSAALNMRAILQEIDASIEVLMVLESVEKAVDWIETHEAPDLAFFDIQLADGNSFEIFERTKVSFPVVFTTAFNEYTLKAFKVNSIDYILKPLKTADVAFAINKYKHLTNARMQNEPDFMTALKAIGESLNTPWKRTILMHKADGFTPISVSDVALFYIKSGMVYGLTRQNVSFEVHDALDALEGQLSPQDFYRANRQALVARWAIHDVSHYFNGRLLVKTRPEPPEQILVSKARAGEFKRWLGN